MHVAIGADGVPFERDDTATGIILTWMSVAHDDRLNCESWLHNSPKGISRWCIVRSVNWL